MSLREIVNDVLHRLHAKDRELITTSSLYQLQHIHHEFSQHLRNFYQLHHPENPLLKEFKPDEILDRITCDVWDHLNERQRHD
jgi:hypothetical protein